MEMFALQCAEYEEVLQMANEIALAYEKRSEPCNRDVSNKSVQTDAKIWRDYRQTSSRDSSAASAASSPAPTPRERVVLVRERETPPQQPGPPRTRKTADSPRASSASLAMNLPCVRPRKANEAASPISSEACGNSNTHYDSPETSWLRRNEYTEGRVADFAGSAAGDRCGGFGMDSSARGGSEDIKTQIMGAFEKAQTSMISFLSPRAPR
jgi:hypothetical protein